MKNIFILILSIFIYTGIQAEGLQIHGDNLGNHKANKALNMNNKDINNISTVTVNGVKISGGGDYQDNTIWLINAQTLKVHQVNTITISQDTWTDVFFSTQIVVESQGTAFTYNQSTSSDTITINQEGFYLIGGCVHYQNNSGGDKTVLVASRLIQDGIEIRCSQRSQKLTVKDGGENAISYNGTAYFKVGEVVKLQLYVSDTSIEFISNSVFDEQVAYTFWLIKQDKD